jgi:threonylcarbamoyladenosine tRNA methylthiotransferase MtaB
MLAAQFVAAGYDVAADPAAADICVVNSCAVTQVAAAKSRRRYRSLRRINPSARLVVTGCHAELVLSQENREATASDDGTVSAGLCVDLWISNQQKDDLVSLVQAKLGVPADCEPVSMDDPWRASRSTSPRLDDASLFPAWLAGSVPPQFLRSVRPRTRPLVKIQDGCDNACTYCIVHLLRGPQRSRPREEILAEILALVRQGYREVVLTGVHVGAYGGDGLSRPKGGASKMSGLTALLTGLLGALPFTARLRLSSIEPWGPMQDDGLRPGFLALWQDPRLCRHLHFPLQSGSDSVLQRMGRHYSADEYAAWIEQARAAIPGLAITSDVIAGFPGETIADHEATLAFVDRAQFARLHVFPYSPRPGTLAAKMEDQIPVSERQRRAAQLRMVGQHSAEAFRRQLLGQTLAVLWETRRADGRWTGLTDNYVRVSVRSEKDLANRIIPVYLCELEPDGMRGQLVTDLASDR